MTKREKIETPTALILLGPARATREVHPEFAPMVLYRPRRGQAMMAVCDGEGTLAALVANVLEQMRARLGPAEWIAVTTDAYAKQTNDPAAHVGGTLEAAFAAGDPDVIEQMVVILRHRYKPTEAAVQSYRYSLQDGFEWDEPEVIENYQGDVLAVLNYYI